MMKFSIEFDIIYDYKNDNYFKNYPNVEKVDMVTWFLGGDIYLILKDMPNSKNSYHVTFSRIEPLLVVFEDLINTINQLIRGKESIVSLEDNGHTITFKSLNTVEALMYVNYDLIGDEFFSTLKKEYKQIKIDETGSGTYKTQDIILDKNQLFEEIFKKTDAFLNHLKQVNPKLLELDWVKRIQKKRKKAQEEFEKYLKKVK